MTFEPGLVTVVVASYNHARYLTRRMDSLLAQTYRQLEIIVIDDRSPDNSVEILRKYESDPRVKVIVREQNGGWVAVSNQGAQLARGEFLLFGNCDDACEPQLIERLVDALGKHSSAAIAFSRSLFTDEEDRVIGDDFPTRPPTFRRMCRQDVLIPGPRMGRFLLDSCTIPNLSAALFRRRDYLDVGMLSPNYRVCSDWDLYFRMAARRDVAYIAAPLNHFRQHETTIRSVTKERVVDDEILTLLLREIRALDLSFLERCRYRTHAMYLWALHIIAPSWSGLRNFPYLAKRVFKVDPPALLFLLPGLAKRTIGVFGKVLSRLHLIPDTPR
jgi:glycosyltransferase involved in cell wall biosynthesis